VAAGKVRHLGVCNFDLPSLKKARSLSNTPLLTDQVPYSLRTRTYVLNGVLEYCQQNEMLLTAYSPVEQGSVLDNPEVLAVARQYGATPAQIALAWLLHQPRVIAIPMSMNIDHLRSNLESLEIELFPDDIDRLDHIVLEEGSIWPNR
jgi:diketogulonate reductase-like aldo/keto reductase